MEVSGISEDGDLMAVTVDPEDNPFGHKIYLSGNGKIKPALAEGGSFYCTFVAEKRCVVGKTFGAD